MKVVVLRVTTDSQTGLGYANTRALWDFLLFLCEGVYCVCREQMERNGVVQRERGDDGRAAEG